MEEYSNPESLRALTALSIRLYNPTLTIFFRLMYSRPWCQTTNASHLVRTSSGSGSNKAFKLEEAKFEKIQSWGDAHLASFKLTYWFRLTPCSAAPCASSAWSLGGMRTLNLPL